ncbi:Uncharacterised protein [Serratia fonticola]|uniref:Uncharacterized protein n=1 Tax=Serratia fonticola TaxID=47917 RepID=A0A4U9WDT9_SERFO|nr:Uncharacterised protein [Serratia fonticola]
MSQSQRQVRLVKLIRKLLALAKVTVMPMRPGRLIPCSKVDAKIWYQ